MRQFYLIYPIWVSVRPELTWSHYRLLLTIPEQHIREYYIEEAVKGNWSVRQLERQINTCAYSRSLKNINGFSQRNFERISWFSDELTFQQIPPQAVAKILWSTCVEIFQYKK
ncbi:MAG: DUF1016 domain-containing protein [Erysipelotrichaceae bacterium]|nr:DUF1016 domain-containing protein [Erysipelotrichaceae bacterium]